MRKIKQKNNKYFLEFKIIINHLINQNLFNSISKSTQSINLSTINNNNQLTQLTTTFTPKNHEIFFSTISLKNNNAKNECGKAPLFTPCVSINEASKRLLNCCKQKLMPLGCQELCRYDITQSEVIFIKFFF